jgi:hypothetical protein
MSKTTSILVPVGASEADVERLRVRGYAPVVRWVHVVSRSDEALKTIDALTRIDQNARRIPHTSGCLCDMCTVGAAPKKGSITPRSAKAAKGKR